MAEQTQPDVWECIIHTKQHTDLWTHTKDSKTKTGHLENVIPTKSEINYVTLVNLLGILGFFLKNFKAHRKDKRCLRKVGVLVGTAYVNTLV